MSNLTVVLYDANLSVVYKGTLALKFDASFNLTGGTLTLDGYPPVTLAQGGGSGMWSLTGSNASVNVSASWMNSASNAENETIVQASVAGTMTISVQGGAAQTLTIFGWDNNVFPFPPKGSTAKTEPALGRKSERPEATAALSNAINAPEQSFPPPDQFNYNLTFIGQNTYNVATGGIVATGQWSQIGPVGKVWRISGNLTFSGGGTFPFTGGGAASYWYADATGGFTYYDISTVTSQAGINAGCTGGLLINGSSGGIVFFVGTTP